MNCLIKFIYLHFRLCISFKPGREAGDWGSREEGEIGGAVVRGGAGSQSVRALPFVSYFAWTASIRPRRGGRRRRDSSRQELSSVFFRRNRALSGGLPSSVNDRLRGTASCDMLLQIGNFRPPLICCCCCAVLDWECRSRDWRIERNGVGWVDFIDRLIHRRVLIMS